MPPCFLLIENILLTLISFHWPEARIIQYLGNWWLGSLSQPLKMPGILPMKVILVGGRCLNCACEKLNCDRGSPKCSNCTSAGIECKRPETRIQQACDRCRSKKIRCDGVRPSCTQCVNLGFECTHNDKISRRAFPRGYTESLEGMVRNLEFEIRELKDLLDEKDEKINSVNSIASEHTE